MLAWAQSWNIFEKLMKVCSPPEFFHKNMSHEQLLFTWSTFHDSGMGIKLKYFWKTHKTVKSARIFSQKHVSRTITFHVIHVSWLLHGYKVEIFLKSWWNCEVRQISFTKTCLTNNYLSCDSHYVILAWVQSWNIFENLMKLWSPPEFFHKKMSHEQLPFMWSTLCDSRMGTELKYFEKFMKLWSQSCWQLRLAILSASFVLMSRQWWPKCIYSVTVTLSVFVPVLNALVRLYSDLPVLWPNPQWSNVLIEMENICLIGSLRKT